MQSKLAARLEQEAAKRASGDAKTVEVVARLEDFCTKLGEKMLARLGSEPDYRKQILAEQRQELDSCRDDIRRTLQTAAEEMGKAFQRRASQQKDDMATQSMTNASPFSRARAAIRLDDGTVSYSENFPRVYHNRVEDWRSQTVGGSSDHVAEQKPEDKEVPKTTHRTVKKRRGRHDVSRSVPAIQGSHGSSSRAPVVVSVDARRTGKSKTIAPGTEKSGTAQVSI